MLPPIAPSVLENNPKFKALYTNLAGSRLNADASTRLIKQQRAQAEIEKQLTTARKDAAQRVLLQDALQTVASRMGDLPSELIETCHIVSAQLNGNLSPADQEILLDEIDSFISNIPTVALALSDQLLQTAKLIAQLLQASTSTSATSNDLPSLAKELVESIQNQSTALTITLATLSTLSSTLQQTYTHTLDTSIRSLEQTIHGSIARGTRAHAEHLSTVAKGLELKLQVMALTDPVLTSPDVQADLEGYKQRLVGRAEELMQKVGEAEKVLADYGRAGRGMLEIARRFADVKGEMEGVKGEIERLEARASDVD